MKILPELEVYRDRLMTRAATWVETSEADLLQELDRCLAQVALLEKAVSGLRRELDEVSPEAAGRIERRLSIQDQTRELTAAYAVVLRRHLEGRVS